MLSSDNQSQNSQDTENSEEEMSQNGSPTKKPGQLAKLESVYPLDGLDQNVLMSYSLNAPAQNAMVDDSLNQSVNFMGVMNSIQDQTYFAQNAKLNDTAMIEYGLKKNKNSAKLATNQNYMNKN